MTDTNHVRWGQRPAWWCRAQVDLVLDRLVMGHAAPFDFPPRITTACFSMTADSAIAGPMMCGIPSLIIRHTCVYRKLRPY
jgi:hypothetical protein